MTLHVASANLLKSALEKDTHSTIQRKIVFFLQDQRPSRKTIIDRINKAVSKQNVSGLIIKNRTPQTTQ